MEKIEAGNVFPTSDVGEYLSNKSVDFTESGKWLKMRCLLPGHNDKTPSFFIHKIHGGFNCYGCGEHGNWGKLLSLLGWQDSSSPLVDITHKSIWADTTDRINELKNNKESIEHSFSYPKDLQRLDGNNKKHRRHWNYIKDRRLLCLTSEYALYCSFEYDEEYGNMYNDRIMIPVHNSRGQYVWMEGRKITKGKEIKYYRPPEVIKTNYLFNMHRVLREFNHNKIIVVEGILDAMLLFYYNFPAVCCFGSDISDSQLFYLVDYDNVILALDNDEAGIRGYVKAKKKMFNLGMNLMRVLLPKKLDVCDLDYSYIKHKFTTPKKIN